MGPSASLIAAIVLAATFAWAATAKLLAWRRWVDALASYRLPRRLAPALAVAVPVAELGVAGLVAVGRTDAGAAAAAVLLGAFSAATALAASRNGGRRLPCGCFGRGASRSPAWVLGRNVLLLIVAAVVFVADDPVRLDAMRWPKASEVVAAALVVAGSALALWTAVGAAAALRRR